MIRPNWSTHIEYAYYDLGKAKSDTVVPQIYAQAIPPVAEYGAAKVSTIARVALGSIHVGVNYHFENL